MTTKINLILLFSFMDNSFIVKIHELRNEKFNL